MTPEPATLKDAKHLVLDFFELAFVQRSPQAAAERYLSEAYIQHNPQAPSGRDAFAAVVEQILAQAPEANFDLRRVIAEDDLVVLHYLLRMAPQDRGSAVIDIFRVDGGRIAEHWDVMQPVPEASANDNGMV
jgi:predicted SnoaL-like aldol condensation-catalyzing enzyme